MLLCSFYTTSWHGQGTISPLTKYFMQRTALFSTFSRLICYPNTGWDLRGCSSYRLRESRHTSKHVDIFSFDFYRSIINIHYHFYRIYLRVTKLCTHVFILMNQQRHRMTVYYNILTCSSFWWKFWVHLSPTRPTRSIFLQTHSLHNEGVCKEAYCMGPNGCA